MNEREFTTTRTTPVSLLAVQGAIRAAVDPTVSVAGALAVGPSVTVGKATPWTGPQITAAQLALDTATNPTPQQSAQSVIDAWPLELKAAFLLVMEQMNVVRAALPVPLAPFTAAQFLTAIKAKAATL